MLCVGSALALVYWSALISASPGSTDVRYKLADCYLRLGKTDKAVEHVDRVLRSEPDHEDGLALKAQIHIALGQMDEAAAIYRALVARGDRLPVSPSRGRCDRRRRHAQRL